jgi:hypothetical protein
MPGYNSQRRGTASTLPKSFVLFYVLFVLCRSVYCLCVNVYCTTATKWLPNCSLTNISHHIISKRISKESDIALPVPSSGYFSWRSSSCLRRLRRRAPCICSSVTCFRRQFLCKMWSIQLAFHLFIVRTLSLSSLTLCNTSFFTRKVLLISSNLRMYINTQSNTTYVSKNITLWFSLHFKCYYL